jgi:hypothetical protein
LDVITEVLRENQQLAPAKPLTKDSIGGRIHKKINVGWNSKFHPGLGEKGRTGIEGMGCRLTCCLPACPQAS